MIKRTFRIVSLALIVIGLVAADVTIPWGEGVESSTSRALAQSRKRAKKKRHSIRRKRSRRSVSARRGRSRHYVSARRGRARRSVAARRGRSGRRVVAHRRRPARVVSFRAGQYMPPERVLEIQRALVERKFLAEATGVYDNATVEAMKAFQAAEKLPVTGYPTARVLQRLGLSLAPPKPSATSENEVAPNSNQPEKP